MSRGRTWVLSATAALAGLALPAQAGAGQNVYVTGSGSAKVAAFDIGADGSLTTVPGSPFATGVFPTAVVITPDGRHVYVANPNDDDVSAFDVGSDGSLSPLQGSPFAAGNSPFGASVTPDGKHLYVTDSQSPEGVFGFDIGAGGALTPITGSPFTAGSSPLAVAVTPDGKDLYATNLLSANVSGFGIGAGGVLTPLPGSPFANGSNSQPRGLAFTPDGSHLYVANSSGTANSVSAFSVGANGALAAISGSPFAVSGTVPIGVVPTPNGRRLYVIDGGSNNITAFTIGADGALTPVQGQPFMAGTAPNAGAITPNGRHLYVANMTSNDISGFNPSGTGSLFPIPGTPFSTGGANNPNQQSVAITPNQGPTALFTGSVQPRGSATAFDASASSDPDGSVARFDWDFGDGQTAPDGGPTQSHTYADAGTFTVKLTVTDDEGCSASIVYSGQTASCNGGSGAVLSRRLTIPDEVAPELTLSGRSVQRLARTIAIGAECDEPCDALASGRLVVSAPRRALRLERRRVHRAFRLRPAAAHLGAAGKQTLRLGIPRRARRAAAIALSARGGRVVATITVKATDDAGNVSRVTRRVKLR